MPAINTTDLINAKLDADTIAGVATSTALTVTDRLGNTKNTLAGMSAAISASTAAVVASAAAVQGSLGYLPPVAYAAGISLTLAAQTVEYSGQTYAPILSALPFTTSGTFETAKFRLIQGVSGADLAAPGGAGLVGGTWFGGLIARVSRLGESIGSTLIGFVLNVAGGIQRSLYDKLSDSINVKDFGPITGVDDNAVLQSAINSALSFSTPLVNGQGYIPIIKVSALCRITSSLMIDRVEGGQTGVLRFVGDGKNGGFVTTLNINMFDTTLAGNTETTKSVLISFERLMLQGSSTVQSFLINAQKFTRIVTLNCVFRQLQLCYSNTGYIQSVYVKNSFIRELLGPFITATDLLDVSFTGNQVEVCAGAAFIAGSGLAAGGRYSDNLIQNNGGDFLAVRETRGVSVCNNYSEANVGRLLAVTGEVAGTTASGNYIYSHDTNVSNPSFYEIDLGNVIGFKGFANYTSSRLYKFAGPLLNASVGEGDAAVLALYNIFPKNTLHGELAVNSGKNVNNFADASFLKKDSRTISTNTVFIVIGLGSSCGTAMISLVCSGIQPGAGYLSIVKEWFVTRDGPAGAVTVTEKLSQSNPASAGWVTATAAGDGINLTYIFAGTSPATFNSVVQVLAVSGDSSSQTPTMLVL